MDVVVVAVAVDVVVVDVAAAEAAVAAAAFSLAVVVGAAVVAEAAAHRGASAAFADPRRAPLVRAVALRLVVAAGIIPTPGFLRALGLAEAGWFPFVFADYATVRFDFMYLDDVRSRAGNLNQSKKTPALPLPPPGQSQQDYRA